MRSRLMAGCLAIAMMAWASAALATGTGSNGIVDQTLTLGTSPAKLPESGKPRGVELSLHGELADSADPAAIPAAPSRITVDLDDDYFHGGRKFPVCRADLSGADSNEARDRCPRKSLVGGGSATVRASFGGRMADLPATITLFNGPDETGDGGGSNPTILAHAYLPAADEGAALPLALTSSPRGPDFGTRMALDVPDFEMPGVEASITALTLKAGATIKKVKKKKRRNGKTKKVVKRFDFIGARCSDADRRLDVAAVFEYRSGDPIELSDSVGCRVR